MMIRRTKTIASVASRSVPLICLKTSIASAENPAGPVTSTWSPGGARPSALRRSSTAVFSTSDLPPAKISVKDSAVVPSRETCGPVAPRTPLAGGVTARERAAAIRAAMNRRSAAFRPSGRR